MLRYETAFPRVSIVVPVYNEEEMISACLESLLAQRYPKELLEIIIVDNNSTDNSSKLIKKYPVKYVFEGNQGRSAARNTGIAAATGDIIAFTDADCVAGKHWVKSLAGQFNSPKTGCCTGVTKAVRPGNFIGKIINLIEEYRRKEPYDTFAEKYFLDPLFGTCNLACRSEVFKAVGVFDESLEAAEDLDLIWRVNLAGYHIRHSGTAVVAHKLRDKLSELAEFFFVYPGYWQYWIITKYKHILGFRIDRMKTVRNFISDLFGAVKSLFKKDKRVCVYHIFRAYYAVYLLVMDALTGIRKFLGKRKEFLPLSFKPKNVIWRWKDGDVMIIDLTAKDGFRLSGSGARAWELLDEGKDLEEIVNTITRENDVTKREAEKDVSGLIEELKSLNLCA